MNLISVRNKTNNLDLKKCLFYNAFDFHISMETSALLTEIKHEDFETDHNAREMYYVKQAKHLNEI